MCVFAPHRCVRHAIDQVQLLGATWRRAGERITIIAPWKTKLRSKKILHKGFTCKSLKSFFFFVNVINSAFFFFIDELKWTLICICRVYCRKHRDASSEDLQDGSLPSPSHSSLCLVDRVMIVLLRNSSCWFFPGVEEDGGVANDSDASPPQSRGRGRLEKGRGKAASRGQSEESRSTSSQAAEEESSSHVKTFCGCKLTCTLLNLDRFVVRGFFLLHLF